MKKYWGTAIFLLLIGFVVFIVLDESHLDKEFCSNIHRYKDARKEIVRAIPELSALNQGEYRSGNGLKVKYTISQAQAVEYDLDTLVKLFEDDLLQELIVTSTDEILFHLKTCNNLECSKNQSGFTGTFSHYLSKNRVNFLDEPWVEVKERENVEEWAYCIVWTQKG